MMQLLDFWNTNWKRNIILLSILEIPFRMRGVWSMPDSEDALDGMILIRGS